jgi:hypothetical protein
MTYGCEHLVCSMLALDGAAVSHLAELVKGYFVLPRVTKTPSSGPSGHVLPMGRRGAAAPFGTTLPRQSRLACLRAKTTPGWTTGAELC